MTSEPTYRVRSPGRVNLIGEHTDYTGGYVMPFATDLHTQLEATPSSAVEVASDAVETTYTFETDALELEDDWIDYVKGCYAILQAEGYEPGGFTGELSATLPLGSGLSSSASLELAVMGFLNEAYDLGLSRERMAVLSQRVENEHVGMSCGIMDQFAVALGQDDHALMIDTETLEYEPVPMPEGIRVVVFHTGVSRELVDSAYNQRRETVERALAKLGVESSKAVSEDDLDELSALERDRLGFVVRENNRVTQAKAALSDGDLEQFGELLVDAHRDIAEHYEASCAELDYVVEQALEEGAYGARLTGAGWGGAAIALVDDEQADAFADSLAAAYRDQFPDLDPATYPVTPSAGVQLEQVE
ncbi:galactokinase [Halorhabdus sp. CUG00001]|uniref:galactokinase n=1 Tax=Halorhabdus sp. CUG00001 TaxID=2600297 RepID=UPI00131DB321|nr:galactokinase [Halorhabdus sp. CUG00001]